MTEKPENAPTISGSGGIGKSDGSGGVQAQNTLQSNTLAQIIEMLGEGPIGGLVNGSQSIFFNETPLQNSDGTYNFGGFFTWNSATNTYDPVAPGTPTDGGGGSKIQGGGSYGPNTWMSGVAWQATTGLPDQAVLAGYPSSATTTAVNVQILNSVGPIVRTIEDTDTTSVIVTIGIPALSEYDATNGNLNGASVSWTIDVAPYGGDYVNQVNMVITNQKCTSLYLCQSTVTLPAGGAPWNIRVTRTCGDNLTDINYSGQTWWESYTEVVSGQFIYPNTALVGLTINAQFFGSTIPTRGYLVNGLLTDIPSNYTPTQGGGGTYAGVWDGTFQTAWHSNPAWVLYALLTNDRWGLGEYIDAATVDKWGLYAIAQYCDELIPSGFTDSSGVAILEPRYVFNGVINSREEAFKVLQNIASCFRGMVYWSLGQVFAVADMPTDPITTIAPANVIGGVFNYSGTAMKARHSVASVSWNDPQDFYRPAVELVQNDPMIQLFGWRQVDVAAPGCTSRGQAVRYGKWLLAIEQYETETVEFTMSWDSYVLQGGTVIQPGNIIFIADPRKTGGARIGGRLKAVTSTSSLTIDAPFVPTLGDSYTLTVMQPDGTIETQSINYFDSTGTVLTMAAPFAQTPNVGAMWVIQGTDVNPRQYRVLSVQEQDSHLFKITALFYDPQIYALVEDNLVLSPPSYVRPPLIEGPPLNGTAVESNYFINGAPASTVTLSWTQPAISIAVSYNLTANGPDGTVNFGNQTSTSVDLENLTSGDWTFFVCAIGPNGVTSVPLPIPITVQGWSAVTVPTVVNLALLQGGTTFSSDAPTITWNVQFPSGTPTYALNCVVRVYDPDTLVLLRTETVSGTSYTYTFADNTNDAGGPRRNLKFAVSAVSLLGIEQPTPATIIVGNPQQAAITPVVSSVLVSVNVSWTPADLLDYAGAMVWVSSTSGFNPLETPPSYQGPNTSAQILELTEGTYYVIVACYDEFGTNGLNFGGEVAVAVTGMDVSAFNNQLQDLITAQFQAINTSIQDTQSIIASAATEQDAANWLDKYNVKSNTAALLSTQITQLSATVGENISTATADAVSTAEGYTDSSIASYNEEVQALYATQTSVSTAVSAAISTAESNASAALSAYESTVAATYATLSGLSSAQATTLSSAESFATGAVATLSSSVSASIGSVSSSVTTLSEAVATINGTMASTWQLTLTSGAYISGIKLYDGGGSSSIVFDVDNFEVVSLGNGIGPLSMFAIENVNGSASVVVNGNMYADGTIEARMMAAGSITAANAALGSAVVGTANIQNLAVDTLQVAGNAITIPQYTIGYSYGGNNTYQDILNSYITVTAPAGDVVNLFAVANIFLEFPNGAQTYGFYLQVYDGVGNPYLEQFSVGSCVTPIVSLSGVYTFTATGSPQTFQFAIWFYAASGYSGPGVVVGFSNILILSTKR